MPRRIVEDSDEEDSDDEGAPVTKPVAGRRKLSASALGKATHPSFANGVTKLALCVARMPAHEMLKSWARCFLLKSRRPVASTSTFSKGAFCKA